MDPRIVPEDRLDAVAVVDVDVDVGHPLGAVVEQPPDADGDVVVDAEPGGVAGRGVVQPPAVVDPVLDLARPDLAAHRDGPGDDARAGLVHPDEGGVVLGAETAALVRVGRVERRLPDCGDIRRVVDGGEHLLGADPG